MGKLLALTTPHEIPTLKKGEFSANLDVDKAVGVIEYIGPDVNRGLLPVGRRVYYRTEKSERIRMRGQDLIIVSADDIVAVLVNTEGGE